MEDISPPKKVAFLKPLRNCVSGINCAILVAHKKGSINKKGIGFKRNMIN